MVDGVDGVLESMQRHTWYLDGTLVPLALLDKDISVRIGKQWLNDYILFQC